MTHREYADINREKLSSIKIEKGCNDCGYNASAAALEFDHKPGSAIPRTVHGQKNGHITVGSLCYRSWKRIQQEVDKCEVVCCNCHAIRTFKRRIDPSGGTANATALEAVEKS